MPLDSIFLDLLTGGWVDELTFLAVWLPALPCVVLKKSDFLPFLAAGSRLKSTRERVCSSSSLMLSSSPDSDNSSSDGPGIAELPSSKPHSTMVFGEILALHSSISFNS